VVTKEGFCISHPWSATLLSTPGSLPSAINPPGTVLARHLLPDTSVTVAGWRGATAAATPGLARVQMLTRHQPPQWRPLDLPLMRAAHGRDIPACRQWPNLAPPAARTPCVPAA